MEGMDDTIERVKCKISECDSEIACYHRAIETYCTQIAKQRSYRAGLQKALDKLLAPDAPNEDAKV